MDITEANFDPAISDRDKELKAARNSDQEIHLMDDLPEKRKSQNFFSPSLKHVLFLSAYYVYISFSRV